MYMITHAYHSHAFLQIRIWVYPKADEYSVSYNNIPENWNKNFPFPLRWKRMISVYLYFEAIFPTGKGFFSFICLKSNNPTFSPLKKKRSFCWKKLSTFSPFKIYIFVILSFEGTLKEIFHFLCNEKETFPFICLLKDIFHFPFNGKEIFLLIYLLKELFSLNVKVTFLSVCFGCNISAF